MYSCHINRSINFPQSSSASKAVSYATFYLILLKYVGYYMCPPVHSLNNIQQQTTLNNAFRSQIFPNYVPNHCCHDHCPPSGGIQYSFCEFENCACFSSIFAIRCIYTIWLCIELNLIPFDCRVGRSIEHYTYFIYIDRYAVWQLQRVLFYFMFATEPVVIQSGGYFYGDSKGSPRENWCE